MRTSVIIVAASLSLAASLKAQKPEAIINKASVAPVIGGEIDQVWSEANTYAISRPFANETPTLGSAGETTWKALWTHSGIFVLIEVTDDDFLPYWAVASPEESDWQYDKAELYFDCNKILEDGLGPQGESNKGHYMFYPAVPEEGIDGTPQESSNCTFAYKAETPSYSVEFYIPWKMLFDHEGNIVDREGQIGFDVTIIDRDSGDPIRQRAVWANDGNKDESWGNMDDCGIITLKDWDPVPVSDILLEGGDITEDNSPLQIQAIVHPDEASDTSLLWTVENQSGTAMIDQLGLLTPLTNGMVKVVATALDGSGIRGETLVNISGQMVVPEEISLIRNGNFLDVDSHTFPDEWLHRVGGQVIPFVADGHLVLDPDDLEDMPYYNYQFGQQDFGCNNSSEYLFSFVAWADAERPIVATFEDPEAGWFQYGTSDHEFSEMGSSEWMFTIGETPVRYEFFVSFGELTDQTSEQLMFQLGESGVVTYLDSVQLIDLEDFPKLSGYKAISEIVVSSEEAQLQIAKNETLQMYAIVHPADATLQRYHWSVIPGTGTAVIDSDGMLRGTRGGTVTVIATAKDGSGIQGSLDIEILVNVQSISIQSATGSESVEKDSTLQLEAAVLPEDATNKSISWSVSRGTGQASISEDGLLTGLSKGTVVVMAFANDGSNVFGAKEFEVSDISSVSNQTKKIEAYPNPADQMLFLRHSTLQGEIRIYNSQGVLCHRIIPEGVTSMVDLSTYPAGIYILRSDHQVFKFIKISK